MKRRIFIALLVLGLLLLIGNLVVTHFASRALNEAFREVQIVQDGVPFLIQFSDSDISTLNSQIELERLRIRNLESGEEFRVRSFILNVPHRELIKLLSSRRSGERPEIRNGSMELRDIALLNADKEMRYTVGYAEANVSGDLFEMYRFIRTDFRHAPDQSHDIRIRLNDIRPGTEPLPFIPVELPINRLDRLALNVSYDHLTDAFLVNRFDISIGADRVTVSGRLSDVSALSAFGSDAETADTFVRPVLSANLRIMPIRPEIPIGNDGMAVHFRNLEAAFEGPLVDGFSPQVLIQTQFSEMSVNIEELTIFPPDTFTEVYGQPLSFLGVPSDRFSIPGIRAAARITDNVATINEFELFNPFAEVNLAGQLLRTEETGLWMWDDARLLIRPSTTEAEQFIRMMTSFFDLRLPQSEGVFRIPVSGSLQAPRLEGIQL